MSHGLISPVSVVPHDFESSLTDEEILALTYDSEAWLRPEQYLPRHDWKYLMLHCGRGWGKTLAIGNDINKWARSGKVFKIGLMAPTEPRIDEVQIAGLIESAPPWFRPEKYGDHGLIWPNGCRAIGFTPSNPGRSRSENLDLAWLTELVDWQESTRVEAFNTITTACRVGPEKVYIDTTSMGRNELIEKLFELNAEDPHTYPIIRGELFDNPMLTKRYVRSECRKYSGQRYDEEILGKAFRGEAQALWRQVWLDRHRVRSAPQLIRRIVGIDPALSKDESADEVGLVVGGNTENYHAYILEDLSKKMGPDEWGEAAVDACIRHQAVGAVIERNHLGDNATFVVRSCAAQKDMIVRVLEKNEPWPAYDPGVIYVREVVAASSKTSRAGAPATETKHGRVHLVGKFEKLEKEMTTYVPGTRRSPNRYDAAAYLVTELLELSEEQPGGGAEADMAEGVAAHEVLRERARSNPGRGILGI